jgi:P27 family predicted phage terminase small subunit
MKGRKPKAREVQLLEGRDKKNPSRFANDVPQTVDHEPQMPEHFDDQAKEAWNNLREILSASGMWTATYQVTLELYCETYSNYRRAVELVRISGQALRTQAEDGSIELKRNPYSVELHRYKDELIKLSAEFGLTPSSRSRIALDRNEDTDSDFLSLLA